ncbi:MAG: hypothetical protein WCR01_09405 [Bacteroidota bacterium]
MKKEKKMTLPEVQILGDLKDVKNLIRSIEKKKSLVIFVNGEQESFYVETDGKIELISQKGIKRLEKKFKLIFFSFFPSRKKTKPVLNESVEASAPVVELTKEVKDHTKKPGKKEKKEK